MDKANRQFENEARERLATMEAQHDNLEEKVDDIREGQKQIIDRLEDGVVTEDDFEPIAEKADSNEDELQQAKSIVAAIVTFLTVMSGLAGLVVLI